MFKKLIDLRTCHFAIHYLINIVCRHVPHVHFLLLIFMGNCAIKLKVVDFMTKEEISGSSLCFTYCAPSLIGYMRIKKRLQSLVQKSSAYKHEVTVQQFSLH